MENFGQITSNGSSAPSGTYTGGSSGEGSVNLFYNLLKQESGSKILATGGSATQSTATGGAGGNGSITKGKITDGSFVAE